MHSTAVTPRTADSDTLWRLFAPAIAGADRIRVEDGQHRYPAGGERRLDPARRPTRPTAVRLFDDDGTAGMLSLDFDATGPGGRAQVAADVAAVCELLELAGARYLIDRSPSAGQHVYIPLADRYDREELQHAAARLRLLCPSLDTSMYGSTVSGCLRPPGSAHKLGGHQQLVTALASALAALNRPAPREVWQGLLDLLPEQLASPVPVPGPVLDEHTMRPLAEKYRAIALTGHHTYRTGSEARQAVLSHAICHGWPLEQIRDQLHHGDWPGFTGFYDRYGQSADAALDRDYVKAYARIACSPIAKSLTRATHSQGGDELGARSTTEGAALWDYLRRWSATVNEADRCGRWSARARPGVLAVLAALVDAARRTQSPYVAFGTRHLSYGAGLVDRSTAAAVLRTLRDEPDPLVELIEGDRGVEADLYLLRIPALYGLVEPVEQEDLHAVPLVFGELGLVAWLIWRAARAGAGAGGIPGLAKGARVSPSTVYRHLDALVEHALVRAGSLDAIEVDWDQAAEQSGAAARAAQLISRWRVERNAFRIMHGLLPRRYVLTRRRTRPVRPASRQRTGAPATKPTQAPGQSGRASRSPTDIELAALALLSRELGAVPLVPKVSVSEPRSR